MQYELQVHLPFIISISACSFIFILSIILFALMTNILRQSKSGTQSNLSMNTEEVVSTTMMIFFFFIYSLAEPLVYLSASFEFTKWITRIELTVSLYAVYYVFRYILAISGEDQTKPAKIVGGIFLGLIFVLTLMMIGTDGLVTEEPRQLAYLGWELNYDYLFFFVYAPILYLVIIYSGIKLIVIRKKFRNSPVERLRFGFITVGIYSMMITAIIEVLKVFNVLHLSQFGDASVIGITLMSLFLGIATILKYFNVQSVIQDDEHKLNEMITAISNIVNQSKAYISGINDNNLKLRHTVLDLVDNGKEKYESSKEAEKQAEFQKENIKNFSTKVIENITTLQSIHSSILDQSKSIKTFFELINKITDILTDISEKGKVISGGVVNLNSVISDAKINAKNSYEIMVGISQSVESINYISQTIQKISEDSNILSMNAAIESANKGEMASGFKVVSDDLRVLSQETTLETDKIYQILQSLDKELVQGETYSQEVEHFFADLEVTVEQIFSFIINIINETKELLSRINTSNEKLLKLQETANMGSKYSEDQQRLNNELNDIVIDVKYFIENIRRSSIVEKESIETLLNDSEVTKSIIDKIIKIEKNLDSIINSVSNRIESENAATGLNLK